MNLQGDLDQKYQVGFYFSPNPKRALQKAAWPENAEENITRLKEAGMPMERGIPKCNRCDGENVEYATITAAELMLSYRIGPYDSLMPRGTSRKP